MQFNAMKRCATVRNVFLFRKKKDEIWLVKAFSKSIKGDNTFFLMFDKTDVMSLFS